MRIRGASPDIQAQSRVLLAEVFVGGGCIVVSPSLSLFCSIFVLELEPAAMGISTPRPASVIDFYAALLSSSELAPYLLLAFRSRIDAMDMNGNLLDLTITDGHNRIDAIDCNYRYGLVCSN